MKSWVFLLVLALVTIIGCERVVDLRPLPDAGFGHDGNEPGDALGGNDGGGTDGGGTDGGASDALPTDGTSGD